MINLTLVSISGGDEAQHDIAYFFGRVLRWYYEGQIEMGRGLMGY